MNDHTHKLILASASSRRIDLLRQINIGANEVKPADIDETPQKREKPAALAQRLSQGKAQKIYQDNSDCFVLAADTVVACGQNILDKAENENQALDFIKKLSGRRHQVYGGICLITPQNKTLQRLSKTIVQFKTLSPQEIDGYIASKEWEGKAGGYAIQGFAGAYIKFISGSYSNVVGLSLYDTLTILKSGGYTT